MKQEHHIKIQKASGEKVNFSLTKLKRSLKRSGASTQDISNIVTILIDELYQGITTKEIYNRAFSLLKSKKPVYASKYKLKKAIYELGPTGFPFEQFIAEILHHSGYQVETNQLLEGKCVTHEIDVIAVREKEKIFIECKFHGEEGRNSDIKTPLYIHSRYQDIIYHKSEDQPYNGWVATNTRFTADALQYAKCVGLYLLSWDYPKGNALKDRIDSIGLYPITVSTQLSSKEKLFLLDKNIVLCKQLLKGSFYLDYLGISDMRKKKILDELKSLCHVKS